MCWLFYGWESSTVVISCKCRPQDNSVHKKNIFSISQPDHMLWVLKRTISMRWFFWAPKHMLIWRDKKIYIFLLSQIFLEELYMKWKYYSTWVCVLPILTMSLNSSAFSLRAVCNISRPGNNLSRISIATATCIAVGNVSFELWQIDSE